MHIAQCTNCSVRVIVLFLIFSPNLFQDTPYQHTWPLRCAQSMHRDVNRIKVSMDFDYKTEIFKASYNTAIIIMQLIT